MNATLHCLCWVYIHIKWYVGQTCIRRVPIKIISNICAAVFMFFLKEIPLLHCKTSCRKKRNPRRASRERGYLVRLRVKRVMLETRPDKETCFFANVFFFPIYPPWFSRSLDKQKLFRGNLCSFTDIWWDWLFAVQGKNSYCFPGMVHSMLILNSCTK